MAGSATLAMKENAMKKLGFVLLAVLATIALSLSLTWLLHLATRPSNLDVVVGLGGSAVCFFLYWEVLKLCAKSFYRSIQTARTIRNPTVDTKESES
jgi:phosphate starvation-inducible membrane PsiE